MTIATTAMKVVAAGNGATTVFAFPFLIPQSGDELVIFTDQFGNETILSQTPALYSVTGFGNPQGGTITYPLAGSPILAGQTLTIARELPIKQETAIGQQGNFYPQAVEAALDYITMVAQQIAEVTARAISVPIVDAVAPNPLPPAAARANQGLAFDANGNPIAGTLPSVPVSAAMTAVFQASSIAAALAALGIGSMGLQQANNVAITGGTISGVAFTFTAPFSGLIINNSTFAGCNVWSNQPRNEQTSAYTLANTDKGATIGLAGSNCYALTVASPSLYDSNFVCLIVNEDTGRGKQMAIQGMTQFILWPQQSIFLYNDGGTWRINPSSQRWVCPANTQIFVDSAVGSDANDGLAAGATNALQHIQTAVHVIEQQIDCANGQVQIVLDPGTYHESVQVVSPLVGVDEFTIIGNPASPGTCLIQAPAGSVCIFARDYGTCTVNGVAFNVAGSTAGAACLSASQFGTIDVENCIFGGVTNGTHIECQDLGSVNFIGPCQITGSASSFIVVSGDAHVSLGGQTFTMPTALTFGTFCSITSGYVTSNGVPSTFTGAGVAGTTGTKYAVDLNGVLILSGTVFPGNTTIAPTRGGQVSA